MKKNYIPTIDISSLLKNLDSKRSKKIIKKIEKACVEVGFFQIINHGISKAQVSNISNVGRKFFKSSKKNKIKLAPKKWNKLNRNIYRGYFHILGGTISSAGFRKEDLLINSLVERVTKDKIEEVILATSATVEGQTTAYYIQDSLKKTKVKITKLAQGLPVGGEIESLDDGTLFSAFKNRSNLNSKSD